MRYMNRPVMLAIAFLGCACVFSAAHAKGHKVKKSSAQSTASQKHAKPSRKAAGRRMVRGVVSRRARPKVKVSKVSMILPKSEPGRLVLQSASVLVQDQATGKTLVEKRSEQILPIASITKLMTAMVVLDARQNLQETLQIENDDVDTLRHSRSRLPVGTRLTREEALGLALMNSENRAAHALGRNYPGGVGAFVAAMNGKARALGLAHARFEDPAGLSGGNVASAQDLVRLVEAAYAYQPIRDFSTRDEMTIRAAGRRGPREVQFVNTNRLVRAHSWDIGLSKTGFIDEAGRCLVMQAKVANRPVVIVLLDSTGKLTRFGDAIRIRQWMERSGAKS